MHGFGGLRHDRAWTRSTFERRAGVPATSLATGYHDSSLLVVAKAFLSLGLRFVGLALSTPCLLKSMTPDLLNAAGLFSETPIRPGISLRAWRRCLTNCLPDEKVI